MPLNGIDISNWQSGLDPAAMAGTDFIIVKATQGTSYVNPSFAGHARGTLSSGRLLGVYHYIDGSGAAAEARHFVDAIRPHIGHALLALDWESKENGAWGDGAYLRQVAQEVIDLTGVRPLVYCSASALGVAAPVAKALDCGLWVAQYASMAATGYQQHPWNEGEYQCAIRQYSSAGRIAGYAGCLDLDLAYMDRAAWMRYAAVDGKPQPAPRPQPAPAQPDLEAMATDTIAGRYGNGQERRGRLGRWYDRVMDIVNQRLGAGRPSRLSVDAVARQVIQGKYGNEPQRTARLRAAGYDPAAVQQRVNALLGVAASPAAQRVYVVKPGDNLSVIGNRLGVSWQRLAQANGLRSPYIIHPGDRLRY